MMQFGVVSGLLNLMLGDICGWLEVLELVDLHFTDLNINFDHEARAYEE